MKQKPSPSLPVTLGALGGMGFTIAIPIAVMVVLGSYLDGHFHTSPVFTLLGLLLGLASGFYGAYRLYKSVFQ